MFKSIISSLSFMGRSLSESKVWKEKIINIKRLDVIKESGHCPHDQNPEETNKLICKFIQET